MGCCLRYQNGVLQQLECGAWTDVPGQPSGGIFHSPQPGDGTQQPTPGGGCAQYNGTLLASGRWLVPAVVSTGDTIEIGSAVGATNDGGSILWACPDGDQFFAGVCGASMGTSGSDPLPAVQHMRLIANIGGSFFDAMAGPITVPGGVSNSPVYIQVNDNDLTDNAGQVQFVVTVCNNQAGPWSSTFDFTTNPYTSLFSSIFGTWTPGTGYVGLPGTGQNSTIVLELPCASTNSVSAVLTYDCDGTAGPGNQVYVADSGGFITTHTVPSVGTGIVLAGGNGHTAVTNFEIAIGDGTAGTTTVFSRLVLSGNGPKPAGWP